MKIIINYCYGGFGISNKAQAEYAKRTKSKLKPFYYRLDIDSHMGEVTRIDDLDEIKNDLNHDVSLGWTLEDVKTHTFDLDHHLFPEMHELFDSDEIRLDEVLISIVEEGDVEVNSSYSLLKVIEIPDGAHYHIKDYDGVESIVWSMSEINITS